MIILIIAEFVKTQFQYIYLPYTDGVSSLDSQSEDVSVDVEQTEAESMKKIDVDLPSNIIKNKDDFFLTQSNIKGNYCQ